MKNKFTEKIFFLFLLLPLLPLLIQTHAYAKVTFQGISQKLKRQIEKEFSLKKKENLDRYQTDLIIKRIMKSKKYEKVYAFLNKSHDLIFVAYPLKKIKSLSISGNRSFSKRKIQKILDLFEGDTYRPEKLLESKKALKTFYEKNGYQNIRIKLTKKDKNNFVYLTLNIKETLPTLVSEIEIETENLKLKKKLSSKLKNFKGKKLSESLLESIENQLALFLKENLFFSSRIKRRHFIYNENKTEVKINYKIQDPYQYKLKIKGNFRFSDKTLKVISQFKETQLLDLNFIPRLSKKIKNHYLEYGYTHVKIDQKIKEKKTAFEKEIVFQIQEGPKVRIKKIDVFGDISKPSSYYSNLILKKSSKLIRRGFYNSKDLETGFARTLAHLKNEGYLNAEIYSTRVEFLQESGKLAYVLVFLSEGSQIQIQSINFSGHKSFSKKDLLNLVTFKKNEPLKQNKLIKSIQNIKNFYKKNGFLEVKILNEKELFSYKERELLSDILFKIREGPKVTIASIIIKGNKQTQRKVILKTLRVQKGDTLTPKKISDSVSRLNQTGLFSKVNLKTLEENTNISQRTLVLTVTERNPGLLKLGLGLNNERDITLRGFTRLSYNNLFGTARNLSSRLEAFWNLRETHHRYLENSIFLGYTEPFFLGTLIKGKINFNRSERAFDFSTQDRSVLMKRSYQVETFLEHTLGPYLTAKWIPYGFSADSDFQLPKRKNNLSSDQILAHSGLQLDINSLNNIFSPTKGFTTRVSFRYFSPHLGSSSSIEFIKLEARHSFYIPLGSHRFVFAQSLRGGYIENINKKQKSGIPASQIFILGGGSSLRGFGGRERIPTQRELPFRSINELIITGKNLYYLGKSEFRFSIYKNFGGVLFYDAGEVIVFQKNKGKTKFKNPFKQSIGFGGRIQTPVAPLAFDLGFKIKPLKDESKYRFHFSIGVL